MKQLPPQLNASFFEGNRKRLRELFAGSAPIVLAAHGLLQRNADSPFSFRQDSSFWYFTGLNTPNAILVMDKDREYLIVPKLSGAAELFDGALNYEALQKQSGITTILEEKAGWKQLGSRLKRVKHVATLPVNPDYIESWGMYTNPARARLVHLLKAENSTLKLLSLQEHITRLRVIKQPAELLAMQTAIDITVSTFKVLKRSLGKCKHEYELDALATGNFRKFNVNHAYAPIVAAGRNACTLHYIDNKAALRNKDLVLLDIGAEYQNYSADITRTYAISKPTKRQQAVCQAVEQVQEFGIAQLKPGVSFLDCEKKLRNFMGEKLRELGLIKIITEESIQQYYPHSSHFLGLDTHDVGDYNRPLEPGMVLTVEPGIYIPKESIGVRIEDDIVITAEGNRVMSQKLPRKL